MVKFANRLGSTFHLLSFNGGFTSRDIRLKWSFKVLLVWTSRVTQSSGSLDESVQCNRWPLRQVCRSEFSLTYYRKGTKETTVKTTNRVPCISTPPGRLEQILRLESYHTHLSPSFICPITSPKVHTRYQTKNSTHDLRVPKANICKVTDI